MSDDPRLVPVAKAMLCRYLSPPQYAGIEDKLWNECPHESQRYYLGLAEAALTVADAMREEHLAWKRANSELYRDPSDTTKGDA